MNKNITIQDSEFLKKKISQSRSAFSLLELAFVLLIIGILSTGLLKGSVIMDKARISAARSIVADSEVGGMKGLIFWFETTGKDSFSSSVSGTAANNFETLIRGQTISKWKNSSPFAASSSDNLDLIQTQLASMPVYEAKSINLLPSVRFRGNTNSGQFLTSSSFSLNGAALTFVVVAKRNSFVVNSSVLSGKSYSASLDYDNTGSVVPFYEGAQEADKKLSSWRQVSLATANHPGNNIPYIATSVFNGVANYMYLNGAAAASVTTAAPGNVLTDSFLVDQIVVGCRIQAGLNNCYNGDIAEIMIFRKALNKNELNQVHEYLGKKFKIAVTIL